MRRVSFIHACMADFHLGHKRLACLPDIYCPPQERRNKEGNRDENPPLFKI